jgi:sialic acid synthase SpsE
LRDARLKLHEEQWGTLMKLGKELLMVAEIGANHDGEVQKAHQLIDAMARAGADAVKFQTYSPECLLSDFGRLVEWGPEGNTHREPVGEMFRRIALPREAHAELFAHAREKGMEPFSTIFDPRDVDFLLGLGQRVFKISSGDVNYKQLLEAVAATNLPVIISGGKCTAEDFGRAINVLRLSKGGIFVLHCVASYPTPYSDANLRVINYYKRKYPDLTIGYSDHTQGIFCALAAIALGARIIEKHVTYDKKAFGPDHWFSADEQEFGNLVREGREVEKALGIEDKRIFPSETRGACYARRSIVAGRDMKAGEKITREDLLCLRPGTGIDPFEAERVVGKICKQGIKKWTPLTWDHIK